MAEERKDSFAETVDTAASAAHTVKGAIKAGKAISGAAKGAAAGGPYCHTELLQFPNKRQRLSCD